MVLVSIQQCFILCCVIGRNKDFCDRHLDICNDLVDWKICKRGRKKMFQCETFLISVTTCSNFRNMGIKRQVLRKLGPFIDKTKLCNKRKFWINVSCVERDLQRINARMNVVFNKCCCQRLNGNPKQTIDNPEKQIKIQKRRLDRVTGIGSCLKRITIQHPVTVRLFTILYKFIN